MTLGSSFGGKGLRAYIGCLLFIGSSLSCLTFPPVLLRSSRSTSLESSSQVCFSGDLAKMLQRARCNAGICCLIYSSIAPS